MEEKKKIAYVGIALFILYLCIYYWGSIANVISGVAGAAQPLILGCILAYIVNILMKFYEKRITAKLKFCKSKGSQRIFSAVLSYLSIFLILCGIFYLILPELIACIQELVLRIPQILKDSELEQKLTAILPDTQLNLDLQSKLIDTAESIAGKLTSYMGTAVNWVSSIASAVISVFVALIFSIYILMGKEKICGQLRKLASLFLKEKWICKMNYILGVLNTSFHKFIVGQTTEAVILGSLCILGMFILRLPYAVMLGTFIGFTALIPIAGAYIGAAVGFLMILTIDPFKAVIFVIFIVVLQQIEGNLIYPKVVGSSIGLPGIWVFAAITIGGGVLGIPGMLLGVPVTASIYQMLRDKEAHTRKVQAKKK